MYSSSEANTNPHSYTVHSGEYEVFGFSVLMFSYRTVVQPTQGTAYRFTWEFSTVNKTTVRILSCSYTYTVRRSHVHRAPTNLELVDCVRAVGDKAVGAFCADVH